MKHAAFLVVLFAGLARQPDAFRHHMFADTRGTLHVVEIGAGPPVVFIPSLGGDATQFSTAASAVSRRRRAVIVELRGHGRSSAPADGDYSIQGYARDVATAVDRLQLTGDLRLVGHSMGAGVALEYAAGRPSDVKGLLLVDPIDDPSRRPIAATKPFLEALDANYTQAINAYWSAILRHANAAVSRDVMAVLANTPRETVVGSLKAMQTFDALGAINRYGGRLSSVISELNASDTSLHRISAAVDVREMTGVSHWLHLDRPAAFHDLLLDFLERGSTLDRPRR